MKKYFLIGAGLFALCFGLAIGVHMFHEATPVAAEVIRIADAPAGVVAIPETTSPVSSIVATFVTIFAGVIGTLVSGLVTLILALLAKKFNVQLNAHMTEAVKDAAGHAVLAVEEWAEKQNGRTTPNEKLNKALQITRAIAGTDTVKHYTDEALVHVIEGKLHEMLNGLAPTHDATQPTTAKALEGK